MFRSPHFWGERFRGTVKAREFCCAAFSATYLGQLRGDTQMTLDSDEYGRRTLRFIEKYRASKITKRCKTSLWKSSIGMV
jgi:hypothetical protein